MSKVLVYQGPWRLRLVERPFPGTPESDEVIVRIRATGICGTDIGILRGDYPARRGVTLGHESAGEVWACGDAVGSVKPGDRVVIDPTYYCGHCRMCRTQRPNHCEWKSSREAGVSQDGTFAEFYRTDQRFVHKISDQLDFAAATLTEPLSCALTGIAQLRLRADMDAAIVGAGPMGMLYCYALASRGLAGRVVECSKGRAALCRELLPAGWTIDRWPSDAGGSLDLIVDTSGSCTDWSLKALRRGGQLLTIGLGGGPCEIDPAVIADRSLSIVGSIDSIDSFALAKHMIETDLVPAARLISHKLSLDRFDDAFALLGVDLHGRRRSLDRIAALKVVLTP